MSIGNEFQADGAETAKALVSKSETGPSSNEVVRMLYELTVIHNSMCYTVRRPPVCQYLLQLSHVF